MCHLTLSIQSSNHLVNPPTNQLIDQFCCLLECHMLEARKGMSSVAAMTTLCTWFPVPSCTIVYNMTELATVVLSPGVWGLCRPGRGHGGFLG